MENFEEVIQSQYRFSSWEELNDKLESVELGTGMNLLVENGKRFLVGAGSFIPVDEPIEIVDAQVKGQMNRWNAVQDREGDWNLEFYIGSDRPCLIPIGMSSNPHMEQHLNLCCAVLNAWVST